MYIQLYSDVLIPNYAPYEVHGDGRHKMIMGTNRENPVYFNPFKKGSRFFQDIINDAIEIDIENDDQVIDFCNKYGLPSISGYKQSQLSANILNKYKDYAIKYAVYFTGTTMIHSPVRVWFYRTTFNFYFPMYGYKQKLYVSDNYYDNYKRKYQEFYDKYKEQYHSAYKNFRDFNSVMEGTILECFSDVEKFVKQIRLIINDLSEKTHRHFNAESLINLMIMKAQINVCCIKRKYRQSYKYETLYQAVGLYFMNLLLNKKGLKQCANPKCGKFFMPTHGRQKYCPPPENSVEGTRSSCENTHRSRRYYKRKQSRVRE